MMTQEEQIQYLANIYYLAYADENFEVEEDYLLQGIAKDIGAGYLETRKALDRSMEKRFKIKYPARWSDIIRNLEDLLLVALHDKKFHKIEKKIILTYAKKLKLDQKVFGFIQKQAKNRIKEMGS